MTGGGAARRLQLAAALLALGCGGGDDEQARTDDCAADGSAAAVMDSTCVPNAVAEEPPAPPAPPDESLRPAITAMLGALLDSTMPRPRPDTVTTLVAHVAAVRSQAPAVLVSPRLMCIAPEPLPRRDTPYEARLRFLADPDSALLATLARPGMLLFHPRRCPPTLETTLQPTSARRPPGEDPTYLSVRDLAEGEAGALYADVAVARGARGTFWICAVMQDDLSTARCTASDRTWAQ